VAQIATLRSIVTLCSRRHYNTFTIPLKAGRIPYTISGGVDGLYPGAVRPLTLHVDNPHRFRIKVRSLKVRVGSSDHPGCGPEWIRPKRKVKVSILAPARSRASVGYPVRMLEGSLGMPGRPLDPALQWQTAGVYGLSEICREVHDYGEKEASLEGSHSSPDPTRRSVNGGHFCELSSVRRGMERHR